jgi:hypothetical protein
MKVTYQLQYLCKRQLYEVAEFGYLRTTLRVSDGGGTAHHLLIHEIEVSQHTAL